MEMLVIIIVTVSPATGNWVSVRFLEVTLRLCFRDELCKPPLLSMRDFLRLCLWVLSPTLTHKMTITWFICSPR